ncbi:MAG: SDR family oxidoreductase [Bacteroidetes bacterium]|nr:SDR family oxidoreductase [Bacteroidota bacterium]MBK8145081.1 SDR family oxidoreductase [Bacteroidota bacterium]MBP6314532.1 SDR family oxidoreductase [Chitinophagaceae bacterium]
MRNILIIGGSSGIGKQLTLQLSAENRVYATFNKTVSADMENASFHHLDVGSPALDFDFIPEIVHGFVYCPGSILLKPFSKLSMSDFESDFQLNFLGMVKVLQQILPNLRRAEQASVVLFSSVAVQLGMSFHSSIAAAKGAVEGFTKAMAAEFSPKIRVNCIAPSLTETPLSEPLINTESKLMNMAAKHPLQRIGKPEDISHMVEFLLSSKSSWITGQILHIDGGMGVIK